jgi:hypothetical protein
VEGSHINSMHYSGTCLEKDNETGLQTEISYHESLSYKCKFQEHNLQ